PAIRENERIPSRYQKVRAELEDTLLAVDGAGTGAEREHVLDLRSRFAAVLEAWDAAARRNEDLAKQVNDLRAEYERGIAELELAVLVKTSAEAQNGLGTWRDAYLKGEETYHDAERRYEEIRAPYEAALRAAEQRYEAARAQYVTVVEQLR